MSFSRPHRYKMTRVHGHHCLATCQRSFSSPSSENSSARIPILNTKSSYYEYFLPKQYQSTLSSGSFLDHLCNTIHISPVQIDAIQYLQLRYLPSLDAVHAPWKGPAKLSTVHPILWKGIQQDEKRHTGSRISTVAPAPHK